MSDKLFKILIDMVSDNIDFNNQIKDLIIERNQAIAEALKMLEEELEKERV